MSAFDRMEVIAEIEDLAASLGVEIQAKLEDLTDELLLGFRDSMKGTK